MKKSSIKRVAVMGFHEGNAGQVAEWFEQVSGMSIVAFVEDGDGPLDIDVDAENRKRVTRRMEYPTAGSFKGRPFLRCRDWAERLRKMDVNRILPLTSSNTDRFRDLEQCRAFGFELVSAIHPSAIILNQATIEPGIWINAGAIIGYKAEVRAGAMINTGVQVDHHSILETCCQLDPGVVTAGHVTVRRRAQIHAGAVIINRIEIGEGAIVGAGAVVIRDVPPGATVAGVPARVLRQTAVL